ncbi:MAG: hypothetical protein H0V82_00280 [Candidatus Protochlamydia sp.]|nr:hypothetical protein [Candidatus Protochlamydia sp.]
MIMAMSLLMWPSGADVIMVAMSQVKTKNVDAWTSEYIKNYSLKDKKWYDDGEKSKLNILQEKAKSIFELSRV